MTTFELSDDKNEQIELNVLKHNRYVTVAENCSFNEMRPPRVADHADYEGKDSVLLPSDLVFANEAEQPANREDIPPMQLKNCFSCVHHIKADKAIDRLGIPANVCSVRGLVLKPDTEAYNNCDWAHNDETIASTLPISDIVYIEELVDITLPTKTPDTDMTIDPSQYPTDKPITNYDASCGIRAWREIKSGEFSVMMPIFDANHFTPEERAKIPKAGDEEHIELYQDHLNLLYTAVAIWTQLGETPALNGKAGIGKTEFFRYAAWMMQLPFERVSIDASSEKDELAGRTVLVKDGDINKTEFQYGRIPLAWAKPCVVVIDEPNTGPPDVWQFLRPLLDSSKQLVLDVNKGERIPRNEHCFMGMAMNPAWDILNVGANDISDADGRRLMHISVPEPDEKTERKIIVDRCKVDDYEIPDRTLTTIMKIAVDIRSLSDQGSIPIRWGTAQQIKVARSTKFFPLETCFRLAAADLLEPDRRDQILQLVKSNVGTTQGMKRKRSGSPRPGTSGPF